MQSTFDRFLKGILCLVLGTFIAVVFLCGVFSSNYEGIWMNIIACIILVVVVFEGILLIWSGINRKRHEYYMGDNVNFDLEKVKELDEDINFLDKLIKYIPNSAIVFCSLLVFWGNGFNFYSIVVTLYFAQLFWVH